MFLSNWGSDVGASIGVGTYHSLWYSKT